MFVKFQIGDKVAILDSNGKKENGTVLSVKKTECVVQIDGNETPQNIHKTKLMKLWGKSEEGKYNPFQLVKDFHIAFKHPAPSKPTPMSYDTAYNRSKWVIEEVIEHLHATDHISLKEGKDELLEDISLMIDKELQKNEVPQSYEECLIAQTDALIDQLYFVYGSLVTQGVRPEKLFEIVNSYNMDKLQDGEIVYKDEEKKKIGKREGWLPPDEEIKEEILKQIKEADNNEQD